MKLLNVLQLSLFCLVIGCSTSEFKFGTTKNEDIRVSKSALFPEGIAYSKSADSFFIGSFRYGEIYKVTPTGKMRLFAKSEKLYSILGVCVDEERNRLLAVTSDIGASIRKYPEGKAKLAAMVAFDLSTGELKQYVDLGHLLPKKSHLSNDLTVDDHGNVYITDSFSPVIYKVDINGSPSVFLSSKDFEGEAINLNGIVFHSSGYLLVIKKSEGRIFKVPLENPQKFSEVKLDRKFRAGDGLIVVDDNNLIVITNKIKGTNSNTAFLLNSKDKWNSAITLDSYQFKEVYPTTGTMRGNSAYIVYSHLDQLISADRDKQADLKHKAVIKKVGQ